MLPSYSRTLAQPSTDIGRPAAVHPPDIRGHNPHPNCENTSLHTLLLLQAAAIELLPEQQQHQQSVYSARVTNKHVSIIDPESILKFQQQHQLQQEQEQQYRQQQQQQQQEETSATPLAHNNSFSDNNAAAQPIFDEWLEMMGGGERQMQAMEEYCMCLKEVLSFTSRIIFHSFWSLYLNSHLRQVIANIANVCRRGDGVEQAVCHR